MYYQIYYTKSTVARLHNAICGNYRGYSITYATQGNLQMTIERLRERGYVSDIYKTADDGNRHFSGHLAEC